METVEQFLARGGKVETVAADARTITRDCFCGCRGRYSVHQENAAAYTDKRMRDRENQVGCYSAYWGQQ